MGIVVQSKNDIHPRVLKTLAGSTTASEEIKDLDRETVSHGNTPKSYNIESDVVLNVHSSVLLQCRTYFIRDEARAKSLLPFLIILLHLIQFIPTENPDGLQE